MSYAWAVLFVAPGLGADGPGDSKVRPQYEALLKAYEADVTVWGAKYPPAGKDLDLVARYRDWPGWGYAPRVLALAEADPGDPASVDALIWVLKLRDRVGAHDREIYPHYERAVALLRDHLKDPRVDAVVYRLMSRGFTPASEEFLRSALEDGPDRDVPRADLPEPGRLPGDAAEGRPRPLVRPAQEHVRHLPQGPARRPLPPPHPDGRPRGPLRRGGGALREGGPGVRRRRPGPGLRGRDGRRAGQGRPPRAPHASRSAGSRRRSRGPTTRASGSRSASIAGRSSSSSSRSAGSNGSTPPCRSLLERHKGRALRRARREQRRATRRRRSWRGRPARSPGGAGRTAPTGRSSPHGTSRVPRRSTSSTPTASSDSRTPAPTPWTRRWTGSSPSGRGSAELDGSLAQDPPPASE